MTDEDAACLASAIVQGLLLSGLARFRLDTEPAQVAVAKIILEETMRK